MTHNPNAATLAGGQTVTQEILAWNETMKTSSKSRLMIDGRREDAPKLGLSERQILTIERLALEPEGALGRSRIVDQFEPAFFKTDFWLMWCTTFAFQHCHSAVEFKRYLVRFVHMFDGFSRLKGIMRTVYNQYDSLVRPLKAWLDERGVSTVLDARVTDVHFAGTGGGKSVERIIVDRGGRTEEITIGADEYVIITLGSMTDASSLGTNATPAVLNGKHEGSAWTLWEKIADGRPEFGNP